jgi:hypothetical protein
MIRLRSPVTGLELHHDTPHSLTDGIARWPVVDGIAFLRTRRAALVAETLSRLDDNDRAGALRLLLLDQDDWWRGGEGDPEAIATLIANENTITLSAAMDLLGWGPVAAYFRHRWSDPTFVAGLALVEAHWNAPATAFELACGIGHHLRELALRGVAVTGADVVFAKLWIARHFVVPNADLVCFDAADRWPIGDLGADLVSCHDAFYFLSPKEPIASRLRAVAGETGLLAVGHVHNRDWPNFSAGDAVKADDLPLLFPDALLYDDAELTRAAVEARAPRRQSIDALRGAEAFALARPGQGQPRQPRMLSGILTLPLAGAALARNPLYDQAGSRHFPSERYASEYGPAVTYGEHTDCPPRALSGPETAAWARRRELLDLPERW